MAAWVGERTGIRSFGECQAIGIARDGKIAAGVVYNHFDGRNVVATIAADDPRWCTRAALYAIFAYPLKQLGCARITVIVPAGNERSLRLAKGLGFCEEGRAASWFDEGDGIILGMLRERCRWIRGATENVDTRQAA